MSESKINVGDLVRLKSYGPTMTVVSERQTERGPVLEVVWFCDTKKELLHAAAAPAAFEVVEPTPTYLRDHRATKFSEKLPPDGQAILIWGDNGLDWWGNWVLEFPTWEEEIIHSGHDFSQAWWMLAPPDPN